jgi:hypothetical protein
MCLVNDIENFDATKKFVDLHVGVEALVEVSMIYCRGYIGGHSAILEALEQVSTFLRYVIVEALVGVEAMFFVIA